MTFHPRLFDESWPVSTVRACVLVLGLLVPLHLPFLLPQTGGGIELGWWTGQVQAEADGPLTVRHTIWSARSAGLRPGDVVLSVNGAPASAQRLEEIREAASPGDTITLGVRRGDSALTVEVPVRVSLLSYAGYLWYRLALALGSWLVAVALVVRRSSPATLALSAALTLLPPVLFPIEISFDGRFYTAVNAIWQFEAAAYRFFFPALVLHFLAWSLKPLRLLRDRRIWATTYAALFCVLLLVTDGLGNPLAWASPGLPYTIRSVAGLTTEALVLCAVLYAIRRSTGSRGPAHWLAVAAVFAFGSGVTVSLTSMFVPQAPLLAEGLRQVKSIMLLMLIVTAVFYTVVMWDDERSDWHLSARLAAIASAVLTGLYAFAVAGAAAAIHSLERHPDVMGAILFIGIFVATLAYSPVLRWAREVVVDGSLLASWVEREQRTHEFIDRISSELSPVRIADRVGTELPALLDVSRARLLLAREVAEEWEMDVDAELEVLPRAELQTAAAEHPETSTIFVPISRPDGELMAALHLEQSDGEIEAPPRSFHRTLALGLASALRNAEAHLKLRTAERELLDAERIASLGALAGGLAHEIKNPLAGLKMGIYLLEHGRSAAGAEEKFERIRRDVRRIDDLVTGVLRLTHEGLHETPGPVDLGAAIQQCLDDARPVARDRGIDLHEDVCTARSTVLGTSDQIRLIVSNLLSNAMEAVGEKGTVTVQLRDLPAALELAVRDDGPGIELEDQKRIFDLSYSTKRGGTGLGLALVRREAERLGGFVTARSAPGEGTELRVHLPRARLQVHPAVPA